MAASQIFWKEFLAVITLSTFHAHKIATFKLFYFVLFGSSVVIQTSETKHSKMAVDNVTTELPASATLASFSSFFVYKDEVWNIVQ